MYCSALLVCLLSAPAHSQVTARATALRAEPNAGARELAPLAAGTRLAVGKRQGFWAQASAAGKQGWVRMTDLSFAQAGGAVNLASLDSGRLGKNNIVATSAARGLSADQLRQARPDAAAVAALASLSGKPDVLRSFRSEGGLVTAPMAPLHRRADASSSVPPVAPTTPAKGAANEEW